MTKTLSIHSAAPPHRDGEAVTLSSNLACYGASILVFSALVSGALAICALAWLL